MDRRWIALSLTPILFFAASGGARAAEGDPCPANQPRPSITVSDPAGAGSLYATHILRVRFGASGEDDTELRSFAAPGARILPDDNNPEVVSDTPGQLTLTAEFFIQHNGTSFDDRSYTCTMTVTQTVGLKAPNRAVVGRLTRPRLVDRRRNLWYRRVTYSFTVTSAKSAADRSPSPSAPAQPAGRSTRVREFAPSRGCSGSASSTPWSRGTATAASKCSSAPPRPPAAASPRASGSWWTSVGAR